MTDAFTSSAAVMNGILRLNLQAALLAVFVAIVSLLCRKWLAPRWKSMLWMLVFLRMCLPVSPPFAFSLTNLIPFAGTETGHVAVPTAADPVPRLEHSPAVQTPRIVAPPEPSRIEPIAHSSAVVLHWWSVRDALVLAWLAVAIILLGRLCWLRVLLGRQLSELAKVDHPAIIRLAEASAHDARLSCVPQSLWAPPEVSPAVLGWWRPVLLLPRNLTTLNHQQLRAVLMHEFHHVKSGDTLLAWFPRVICALFWFNPLLWWASRKWHEEREMACDEWVLGQIGPEGKRGYLETLVAIATDSQQAPSLMFTASIVSSPTSLERRILAMKRHRKPGWNGMAAGALVVLIAGIVGLTDRNRAEVTAAPDDSVTNASNNPAPAAADDDDGDKAPAQAQPKALHPNIIFARHVILWEGREIVTEEQLKQRLAEMRAQQPVTPNAYFSLGFSWKSMNEAQNEKDQNASLNRGMHDAMELIGGQDQWNMLSFVERRGSAVFDRIETVNDLTPDSAEKLTGRVLLPGGTDPAVGAQVVILPVGEQCSLYLRNGTLRDPLDEICYVTDDQGVFEAYWGSLEFDQKLLIGDGTYDTVILHELGYLVINGQLASENASYELLPWKNVTITTPDWNEGVSAEVWIKPAGAGKGIPGFSIAWPGPNARVNARVPLGKGYATYVADSRAIDFGQPITITADSPAEIVLPELPADQR